MLLFQIGSDRYVLPAAQSLEVLPWVHWKQIPQAAPGIAGLFNYHGAPVPLVDLKELTTGTPSAHFMSSRIILVRYPDGSGEGRLLGLIVEHLTGTLLAEEKDFVSSGVDVTSAPYLGCVLTSPAGIIQKIALENLLTPAARSQLFDHATGATP